MNLENENYNVFGDDPITNIIPKEYFEQEVKKTYLGNNYGFFIITEKENIPDGAKYTGNLISHVLVFDLNYDASMVERPKHRVTFLYSFEYITIHKNAEWVWRQSNALTENSNSDFLYKTNVENHSNQEYTVVPLYDLNFNCKSYKYYISDVSFLGTLLNTQSLNFGDKGYDVYEDNGSFFVGLKNTFSAYIIKQNAEVSNIMLENLFNIILNIVSGTSDVASIGSIGLDVIKGITSISGIDSKFKNTITVSNESQIKPIDLYISKMQQIENYGSIVRKIGMIFNSSNDDTLLLGENREFTKNCKENQIYTEAEYEICLSTGNQKVNCEFISELTLKIVEDDGKFVDYGYTRVEDNIETSVSSDLIIGDNLLYLLPNNSNYFSFTPLYSGLYCFDLSTDFEVIINGDSLVDEYVIFEKGRRYSIEIKNKSKTQKIITNFKFDVYDSNLLTILSGEQILKINSAGFKKIYLSDKNRKIVKGIEFCELDSNFNILDNTISDDLLYCCINGEKYIVINTKYKKLNVNIVTEEPPILTNESKILEVSAGSNFVKPNIKGECRVQFTASEGLDCDFSIYNDKGSLYKQFSQNGTSYFVDIYFGNKSNYYIGYQNARVTLADDSSREKKIVQVLITKKEDPYIVHIKKTDMDVYEQINDIVKLKIGDVFDLQIEINGNWIENFNMEFSQTCFKRLDTGMIQVVDDCPISGNYDRTIKFISNGIIVKSVEFDIIPIVKNIRTNLFYGVDDYNKPNCLKFDADIKSVDTIIIYVDYIFAGKTYKSKAIINGDGSSSSNVANLDSLIKKEFDRFKHSDIPLVEAQIKSYKYVQRLNNKKDEYEKVINVAPLVFKFNVLFAGGDGSTDNPYKISNSWQFDNIRYVKISNGDSIYYDEIVNANFEVINNIHVKGEFKSLPCLNGCLKSYGPSYNIVIEKLIQENLKCSFGVFSAVKGTISSLNFEVDDITLPDTSGKECYAGYITGLLLGGKIEMCKTLEAITRTTITYSANNTSSQYDRYIWGGIAGLNENGTISSCFNQRIINNNFTTGGIVGVMNGGTIEKSRNEAKIKVVGIDFIINNEYNSRVTANIGVGGIAGYVSYGTIENCEEYNPSYSDANIYLNSRGYKNYYAGGIVGACETCSVLNCRISYTWNNIYKRNGWGEFIGIRNVKMY